MTALYDHVWQPWTIQDGRCVVSADLLAGGRSLCFNRWSNTAKMQTVLIDADLFALFDCDGPLARPIGIEGEPWVKSLWMDGQFFTMDDGTKDFAYRKRLATITDLRAAVLTGVIDQCPNLRFLSWTREPPDRPSVPMNYDSPSDVAIWHRPNLAFAFRADSQQSLDAGMPAFVRCAPLVERLGLWLEVGEELSLLNSLIPTVVRRHLDGTHGIRFCILSGHPTKPTPIASVRSAISQFRAAGVRLWCMDGLQVTNNPQHMSAAALDAGATEEDTTPDDCRVREDVWA